MKSPALIPPRASAYAEPVMPASAREVAELLETEEADLAWIPYAYQGVMWMSRSAQLDDNAPLNRNAMLVVERMASAFTQMAVRGPALVFPEGVPWGPLPGDER